MFNKKGTEQEDLDWGTEATASAAPQAEPENIVRPAAGCIISAGTVFTGNIDANDNVVLEGTMNGDISATGRVCIVGKMQGNVRAATFILDKGEMTGDLNAEESTMVETGSSLTGNITTATAKINGIVKGNITVSGRLVLCAKAVINGDITAAECVTEAGCKICGTVKIG